MAISIKLRDTVVLIVDLPEQGLVGGQVGTIVEELSPGNFEVEFCDNDGRTYGSLALPADQLLILHYEPLKVA